MIHSKVVAIEPHLLPDNAYVTSLATKITMLAVIAAQHTWSSDICQHHSIQPYELIPEVVSM